MKNLFKKINFVKAAFFPLLVPLVLAGQAMGAAITWNTASVNTDTSSASQVSTAGSLFAAVDLNSSFTSTSYTVNGVTFTASNANVVINRGSSGFNAGTAPGTGTYAYANILNSGAYVTDASSSSLPIVLSGLTSGHSYQIQLWTPYWNSTYPTRFSDTAPVGPSYLHSAGTESPTVNVGFVGYGITSQYILGTFTASGTTQNIFYYGDGGYGLVGALQVRDLGPVAPPVTSLTGASIGAATGAQSYDSGTSSFTVVGTGNDVAINNGADNAYFAYTTATGDVEIVARLVSFSYPANRSQAGLMIRQSLTSFEVNRAATYYLPGFAWGAEPTNNDLAFTGWGPPVAGNSLYYSIWDPFPKGINPPYWLKLVRTGNNYGAYWSIDGRDWSLLSDTSGGALFGTGAMNVGLFVASGGSSTSATAVFDHVYVGAPRLKYQTSWVGSTSGGVADGSPSNNIFALWVKGDDGTCYANGNWDEKGQCVKAYKDGKVAFALPIGNSSLSEGTITGNNANLFVAAGGHVYRTDFNGNNSVPVSFTTGLGSVGGVAASATRLFVSDITNSVVHVVDLAANPPTEITATTPFPLPIPFTHPGPIACDSANFWIIDCGSPFPLTHYVAPQSGYTPGVKCYSPTGEYMRQLPAGLSNPTALAIHPSATPAPRLYVCENGPQQNIRYYTGLSDTPTYAGSFGQDGGLWQPSASGTPVPGSHPGQITDAAFGGDQRFYGPTGVGFDSQGNIYVACDGTNGSGTDLRKFDSAGNLVWKQFGLEFVNGGDFDPGNDGADIYTTEERFTMNYANTAPGSEWSYTAYTVNPFKANDLRNDPNAKPHGVQVRRLGGNVFMYTNGMGTADSCYFYRFNNQDGAVGSPGVQGTTAIPCGSILPVSGGMKLWIDTNADGLVTTTLPNEESTIPCTLGGYQSYDVDSQGSIWLAFPGSIPASIMQVPCTGTQTIGTSPNTAKVPAYNLAGSKTFPCPQPITTLQGIKYDQAQDVMYCMGTTADGKWVLARYDNWLANTTTTNTLDYHPARYVAPLPDNATDPTVLAPPGTVNYFLGYNGMGFAGDKVFIADLWGPIRVYDANLGNPVITLNPGPEVSASTAWEDMKMGLNAFKRSNGEYLVLEENDGWYGAIPLYRWTPTADTVATTAPIALTATALGRKVVLAWTGSPGIVTSYNIYRSTSSGAETLYLSGVTTSTFTDLNVTPGVPYYYKVTAVNAAGESALSNEVTATPTTSGAEFVKTDTTTQGTWYTGATPAGNYVYGSEGYEVCQPSATPNYPSYATVSYAVAAPTATPYPSPIPSPTVQSWASSTSDVRALRKPTSSTDRIAAYRASGFWTNIPWSWNVDVGANWHQVAVYMLDWDGDRHDHQVKIYDNTNGAPGTLLDTRRMTDFTQGLYLVWNIRGKVRIEISEFANPQDSTVASGLFFDPVQTPAPTLGWWKLDETSGTIAADSSGAGNNATKNGGTWNASGKINGCLTYGGTNATSNLSMGSFNPANAPKLTYATWFKTSTSGVMLGMWTYGLTAFAPVLYVGMDNKLHGAFWTGAIQNMQTAASVNDSQWHHAALACDGAVQTLYLDGEVAGVLSAPVSQLSSAFYSFVGGQGYVTGWPNLTGTQAYFNGQVDDLRLYNRVLSSSEIWKLYHP